MNYILYGEQFPMIKKRLKRIIKERLNEANDSNLCNLDYGKTNISDIIDELSFCPLGCDRKLVVIDHADFLAKSADKKVCEEFLPYVKEDSSDLDVVFILRNKNIDEKSTVYKSIEQNGQVLSFQELSKEDWNKYARNYFKEKRYEIDSSAINELISRVNNDLSSFLNEAEKLLLYKMDEKKISLLDVTEIVSKPIEDNVFQMSNALFRGENALALSIYRDLKLLGYKATDTLLPMLGSQFRFMYNVLYLNEKGLFRFDIARELGVSEIRVKMANLNLHGKSLETIKKALINLENIDYLSKSGKIDRSTAFEFFLVNF